MEMLRNQCITQEAGNFHHQAIESSTGLPRKVSF